MMGFMDKINTCTRHQALTEGNRPGLDMQALPAESLFQGRSVVVIEFKGERYQLRKTRNDKLILTK